MPFRLRYLAHDFELPEGPFVIGRSGDCQLSLDDPLVSRRHATLQVRSDGVAAIDLESRNGVYVNGTRISGQRELTDGDRIIIGSQEMLLYGGEESRPHDAYGVEFRRATATLVHEISHMFGLSHCVYWECAIAGSNNQAEADRRPLHVCPVCLRKLHFALDFDPARREADLAATLRKLGLDDEAAWSERRAAWIRDGTR